MNEDYIWELDDELYHYGVGHDDAPPGPGSGRFPWGSGENPNQRNAFSTGYISTMRAEGKTDKDIIQSMRDLGFKDMDIARHMKKAGIKETDIAKDFDMSTTQLRAKLAIDKHETRREEIALAVSMHNQGLSNMEIGRRMGKPESTIRNLLKDEIQRRNDVLVETSERIRDLVDKKKYLDVGPGSELYLGVTSSKLKTAVAMLEEEGYQKMKVQVDQMGTNNKTTITVMAPPGTTYKELYSHLGDIKTVEDYNPTKDLSLTDLGMEYPTSLDSKRVMVRWADDGGINQDGVIELRRGVEDISLGQSQYAQVRIAVDDKYYLKGMARYSDGSDMPDGIDVIFNTNKTHVDPLTGETRADYDAMKKMKVDKDGNIDKDNPFGATIMKDDGVITGQRHYIDKDGKDQLSPINKVNDEGSWGEWSKTIASQVLSKQPVAMAKKQLDISYSESLDEFNEIKSLTNPTIKKKLLESFASDCDASAVHLKAAGLPRQASHVLLPVQSMRDDEIYAPNYNPGEKVALIRYPYAGSFESPLLTVNNNQKEAKSFMFNAKDAVGISPKVASQLSGADFDGDTVLVIPVIDKDGNRLNGLRTGKPLKGLENFDPGVYALPEGHPRYEVKNQTKQTEMGKVSNLITDMTIMGAKPEEIERAVRHSMVVIDSEKHHYDYKLSEKVERIPELKKKYQGGETKGASTLISRASSEQRIPVRKYDYTPDPETGKVGYREDPQFYNKRVLKKDGTVVYQERERLIKTTRMAETDDARTLMSGPNHEGMPIERVYADYANKQKALANEARKEMMATPNLKYNPEAKKEYAAEVKSLDDKTRDALMNAPRERQAQIIANEIVKGKVRDNPEMTAEDKKKAKGQALTTARTKTGAHKKRVKITDREWEAIQAGAITDSKLKRILDNTDLDEVKKLATPRTSNELSEAKQARIKAYSNAGYSTSEIARVLGVSTSTVRKYA